MYSYLAFLRLALIVFWIMDHPPWPQSNYVLCGTISPTENTTLTDLYLNFILDIIYYIRQCLNKRQKQSKYQTNQGDESCNNITKMLL